MRSLTSSASSVHQLHPCLNGMSASYNEVNVSYVLIVTLNSWDPEACGYWALICISPHCYCLDFSCYPQCFIPTIPEALSLSSNRSLFSEVYLLFSWTSLSRSHWERELHEAVSAACCFETQLALKWLNSALHFCKCSLELFWLLWNFLPLASVAGISKKHLNKHKRNPWILTCWMLPNEPICCTVIHSLWQKDDMEMLTYICVV